MSEIDAIDFYWRPGCGFSMALDRRLSKLGIPMNKLNIWESPEAADFVRRHAGGAETVPTVDIGGAVMVNPGAGDVLSVLNDRAPHLLPADAELPQPGRLGRAINRLLGGDTG